jgi:hypothetical protein
MRRITLAAIVTLFAATQAQAQAWLPSRGEISMSFVVSNSFVDEHDLNGLRDPNSDIKTQSLLTDVTFGVRDNFSVTVALPLVRSKFITAGTPPHPTILDNGQYHTTFTDLRIDIRYNAFTKRNFVVTPFVGSVTPSHGYEYFAHAAPGRHVNELQVGTYVGTTLDKLLPGMFVQGRYGFGFEETFLDFSHNRSLYSLESGYFATPDLRVFGMVSGQVTHGGVDLSPTARLTWPAAQWQNHDRITRENFMNVGGGVGWTVNDAVDVFGSYTKAVQSRNTHVLDHALMFGVSVQLQKSAIERGILSTSAAGSSASAGHRIARCACQKGLALKR